VQNASAKHQRWEAFQDFSRRYLDLQRATGLLEWDQQVFMPNEGIEGRSRQVTILAVMAHEMLTSPQTGEMLEGLKEREFFDNLDEVQKDIVAVFERKYRMEKAFPTELYQKFVQATTLGQHRWEQAKKESDFAIFLPSLEKIVDIVKQMGQCLQESVFTDAATPYDAGIQVFEPGMTAEKFAHIVENLKNPLVAFAEEIWQHPQVEETPIAFDFPLSKQLQMNRLVLEKMGFSFERGRMDQSTHPFTLGMGIHDVRLTVRLDAGHFLTGLLAAMHEGGHALYEQGIHPSLDQTLACDGASFGIHESQSLFWENQLGRSVEFWHFLAPRLKEWTGRTIDPLVAFRAANVVRPSLIRIDADEVTYPLHIILRFELEKALFSGDLRVKELPAAWNEKMHSLLGITPPDDASGVLQDVHWSTGSFGYFPSYLLGSLYAAQITHTLKKSSPGLWEGVGRGDWLPVREWLRQNIHQYGMRKLPDALIRQVTGESLNPQYLLEYFREKFADVYPL